MKGFKSILTVVSALILMSGCSSAFYSSVEAGDGMYGVHDKVAIENLQKAKAERQRAEAEARRAEWEARLAEAQAKAAEYGYYYYAEPSYSSVVADTYKSAYARRLRGFSSPTYRLPSSYYDFRYGDAYNYVTAYDPAFYNIMVSGDQVWVEPKYISSMFGTWGATNVTLATGSWYFGWSSPYLYDYGAWWGYPRYSWWDWNWGICYNPYRNWWGYGWGPSWGWHNPYWGWGPSYYPPHHGVGGPAHHRPVHGSGASHREQIVGKPSYTSPSSGKSYGNHQPARGTVNGSGVLGRQPSQSGSTVNRGGTAGVRSNGSGSSIVNRNRGGASSFFNYDGNRSSNSSSGNSWNSSGRSSFNSGSSSHSGGGYSGGSSSSGSSHRGGNSLGR